MTFLHAVIQGPKSDSALFICALPSPNPSTLLHPPGPGEGDPALTYRSSTHGPLPRTSHVALATQGMGVAKECSPLLGSCLPVTTLCHKRRIMNLVAN